MKVELWSEITCPWCGLGSHRLDMALERFEHGDEVELIHRSLPLSDHLSVGGGVSVRQALRQHHGLADDSLEAGPRHVEALAAREGLVPYTVLENEVGNTRWAHEFLAHASAQGKNRAAWDRIFRSYFGEARSVFTVDALLDLADELGLERNETRRVLDDGRYRQQVQDEARQAQRLGATGAPFLVIDGHYAVPGAQGTDTLLRTLRQAWDETHPSLAVADSGEGVCGPDGCAVPATRPARA
ncbi:putative DsbA family dithiol-disulfide isomerase [Streptomyces sp. LBL]|uniref:DsbA family oxidoreductase n=1 Tax=Streptomyces sp. LBL TaxID=2940562 RepID=UPI00247514A1|nr:DsbA family oxidoreductase [Streptomyces sp. LBL]MDH6622647.1 putative DsbA family dithiol-disulfide isomerase [Streptomyces sp. LBL]